MFRQIQRIVRNLRALLPALNPLKDWNGPRRDRRRPWRPLALESMETRTLLSATAYLDLNSTNTVNEGEATSLSGYVSLPAQSQGQRYDEIRIYPTNGSDSVSFGAANGGVSGPINFTMTYADNGTFTMTGQAHSTQYSEPYTYFAGFGGPPWNRYPIFRTGYNTIPASWGPLDSATVTVLNVAPSFVSSTLGGTYSEGQAIPFVVVASDPGRDRVTVDLDWDGNTNTVEYSSSPSSETTGTRAIGMTLPGFSDGSTSGTPITIRYRLRDEDGGTTSWQTLRTISITNTTPSLTSHNLPSTTQEGSPFTLTLTGTDAGQDRLRYDVDWGDGTTTNGDFGSNVSGSRSQSLTKTYADGSAAGNNYTVRVRVFDDDGAASDWVTLGAIRVTNVAPTASIPTISEIRQEGRALQLTASASDPAGTSDPLTYSWRAYREGSAVELALSTGQGLNTFQFTPPDDGNYRVDLTVTDGDGGSVSVQRTVNVSNVAPTASITSISSPREVGAEITITASASDPAGTNDSLTYQWVAVRSSDQQTVATATGLNQTSFAFLPTEEGDYEVRLNVSDEDSGSTTISQIVTIARGAPTAEITSISASPREGNPVEVAGFGVDPLGAEAQLTYLWRVFRGNETTPIATDSDIDLTTFSFTPPDDGAYRIELTVTNDGGTFSSVTRFTEVANVAPTGIPVDPLTALEDAAPLTISTAGWFSDVPADLSGLTLSVAGNSNPGLFADVSLQDGVLRVVPAADAHGTAQIRVRATDSSGDSAEVVVEIVLTPVNDPPTALSPTLAHIVLAEDAGPTSLRLSTVEYRNGGTGTFEETDQTLTFTIVSTPDAALGRILLGDVGTEVSAGEMLTLEQLRGLRFVPTHDAFGSGALTFEVRDDGGTDNLGTDAVRQTVSIEVQPRNDAPASNGIDDIRVPRGAANQVIDLRTVFDDIDDPDSALRFEVTNSQASNPARVVATQLDPANNHLLRLNFTGEVQGTATITVRAIDPSGASRTETFLVDVDGHNVVLTRFEVISSANPAWNDPVRIEYTLRNDGDAPTGPFSAELYRREIGSNDIGIVHADDVILSIPVENLDPHQEIHGVIELPRFTPESSTTGGITEWQTSPVTYGFGFYNSPAGDEHPGFQFNEVRVVVRDVHEIESASNTEPDPPTDASPTSSNSVNTGVISGPDDIDWFRFGVSDNSLVTFNLNPGNGSELDPAFGVYSAESADEDFRSSGDVSGRLIFSSDDLDSETRSAGGSLSLVPGNYYIAVRSSRGAAVDQTEGSYRLEIHSADGLLGLEPIRFTGDGAINLRLFDGNADNRLDLFLSGEDVVQFASNRGHGNFAIEGELGSESSTSIAVAGDFNGDGLMDYIGEREDFLFGSRLMLYTQRPDHSGNFDSVQLDRLLAFDVTSVTSMEAVDLNDDGREDLVVLSSTAFGFGNTLTVYVSRPDGTFLSEELPGLFNARHVASGDFNGDGRNDIVAYDSGEVLFDTDAPSGLQFYLAQADGGWTQGEFVPIEGTINDIEVSDLNDDGLADIVLSDADHDQIVVAHSTHGPGVLEPFRRYEVGDAPHGIAIQDVNNDHRLDLVVTNAGANSVSVLLGASGGTFGPERQFAAGLQPTVLAVGDLDGDDIPDVAVAGLNNDVTILHGFGDGRFQLSRFDPITRNSGTVLPTDVNGDGYTDVITVGSEGEDVSLLLGRGDGTYDSEVRSTLPSVSQPVRERSADDVIGASITSRESNSNGRWTFRGETQRTRPDGVEQTWSWTIRRNGVVVHQQSGVDLTAVSFDAPYDGVYHAELVVTDSLGKRSVAPSTEKDTLTLGTRIQRHLAASGDFNRDGRLDLAVVQPEGNRVVVQFGDGNGGFLEPAVYDAGLEPWAIVAGDFNTDGRLDLAVASRGSHSVEVFLGGPRGVFTLSQTLDVGQYPESLVAADLTGDGRLDLATADGGSDTVSMLRWDTATGRFLERTTSSVMGDRPTGLAAMDVDGDDDLDLITTNTASRNVSVLTNDGHGGLDSVRTMSLTVTSVDDLGITRTAVPLDVISGRFFGSSIDGLLVLMTNGTANEYAWLTPDNSAAGFSTVMLSGSRPTGQGRLVGLNAADINGDGVEDILQSYGTGELVTGLGLEGGLVDSSDVATNDVHSTPLEVDLNGDGIDDVLVMSRSGDILYRAGLSNDGERYAAPRILNAGDPAREMTIVHQGGRPYVAYLRQDSNEVVVLRLTADGRTEVVQTLETGNLPVRIAAGRLNADGNEDLVVLNSLYGADGGATGENRFVGSISVFLATGNGRFASSGGTESEAIVGSGPAALELADLDSDTDLDVVVVNQISGDLTLLRNDGSGQFGSQMRLASGSGTRQVVVGGSGYAGDGVRVVESREASRDVIVADFTGDGILDLVVLNTGADTVSFFEGKGGGAYVDALTFQSVARPAAAVAGDFTGDNILDLAILSAETSRITIYRGHGDGTFTTHFTTEAGNALTGLSTSDVNGDGVLDLQAGNGFGDVLTLLGLQDNGVANGRFAAPSHSDRNVPLVVADLDGDEIPDVVLANQTLDQVSVQLSSGSRPSSRFEEGLLAPGAVQLEDLDGDGLRDLIVANTGSNNVLVYRGRPGGAFDEPLTWFAGTSPSGLTVADINGDGVKDLVIANQGSNDLSILLGTAGTIDFTPGARLVTGAGSGPVSTAVMDGNDDGIDDLVVTGAQNGTVSLIPGLGGGFFNESGTTSFSIGGTSQQGSVIFGNTLYAANPFDNSVTVVSDLLGAFSEASRGASISSLSSFRSGGDTPVWLEVADFNFDGTDDIIVANSGDGTIGLLAGDGFGFTIEQMLSDPSLVNPSAIALSQSENGLQIFVTDEGDEVATVFNIRAPVPGSTDSEDDETASGVTSTPVAMLLAALINAPAGNDDSPDVNAEFLDAEWSQVGEGLEAFLQRLGMTGDALEHGGLARLLARDLSNRLGDWTSSNPEETELLLTGLIRAAFPHATNGADIATQLATIVARLSAALGKTAPQQVEATDGLKEDAAIPANGPDEGPADAEIPLEGVGLSDAGNTETSEGALAVASLPGGGAAGSQFEGTMEFDAGATDDFSAWLAELGGTEDSRKARHALALAVLAACAAANGSETRGRLLPRLVQRFRSASVHRSRPTAAAFA